jgi:TPR repeat protein
MYLDGCGVALTPALALKWYSAAAQQNDPYAEYELGYIYLNGVAGPANSSARGISSLAALDRNSRSVGFGASALGAVEGLLCWMFIRYWPPLRYEGRSGVNVREERASAKLLS